MKSPIKVNAISCSPEESMSAITTPTCIGRDPPGSGTLFDRITGFSNEKGKKSSSEKTDSFSISPPIDFANTPPRGRLETTVLDVDNVVHSPKRADASFLNCAIPPIKREKSMSSPANAKMRLERSINTSKTFSLTSSEGDDENSIADEWREVKDPVSGKTYYYNRLSRVSKWKLPKGAVLRQKKKPTKNNSFATAVTDESSLSHLRNSVQQDSERNQTTSAHSSPRTPRSTPAQHSAADSDSIAVNSSDVKSPQDTTMTAGLLFCLYCGLKCRSPSMLESHLPQCCSFIQMQEPELLSTQMEIERVLFRLWSKTELASDANASSNKLGVLRSPIKETIVSGQFQSPFKENRVNDNSNTYSSPKFNVRERNSMIDLCIEKKTCPFCEEALVGGDQFSSHLLKCKERKRRRNMRRTPRKETIVEEFSPRVRAGIRTPGRRMPWE